MFENAEKVSVLNEEACTECDAQLMKVEYKEGKSKLSDDKLVATGCIFCDQELSQLVSKNHFHEKFGEIDFTEKMKTWVTKITIIL